MSLPDLIAAIASADPSDMPAILAACASRLAQAKSAPGAPQADELLNAEQTAKLLGYRASYVYEMLKRGDLPCVRDKKFVRVRKSALDAYIAGHERRGPLPLKVSNVLSSGYDRGGFEKASQTARAHPNRTRRTNQGARDNDREVGNERGEDS
jgi:excisionase family DNA binding protein